MIIATYGSLVSSKFIGTLTDYNYKILGKSKIDNASLVFASNYLTLVPDPEKSVEVVLIEVDDKYVPAIDRYEDHLRLYLREEQDFELNGKTVKAHSYVMNPEYYSSIDNHPSVGYVDDCMAAYLQVGLPVKQLSDALQKYIGERYQNLNFNEKIAQHFKTYHGVADRFSLNQYKNRHFLHIPKSSNPDFSKLNRQISVRSIAFHGADDINFDLSKIKDLTQISVINPNGKTDTYTFQESITKLEKYRKGYYVQLGSAKNEGYYLHHGKCVKMRPYKITVLLSDLKLDQINKKVNLPSIRNFFRQAEATPASEATIKTELLKKQARERGVGIEIECLTHINILKKIMKTFFNVSPTAPRKSTDDVRLGLNERYEASLGHSDKRHLFGTPTGSWQIHHDDTIKSIYSQGLAGSELVTPIMKEQGIDELCRLIDFINTKGEKFVGNSTCGIHAHVDTRGVKDQDDMEHSPICSFLSNWHINQNVFFDAFGVLDSRSLATPLDETFIDIMRKSTAAEREEIIMTGKYLCEDGSLVGKETYERMQALEGKNSKNISKGVLLGRGRMESVNFRPFYEPSSNIELRLFNTPRDYMDPKLVKAYVKFSQAFVNASMQCVKMPPILRAGMSEKVAFKAFLSDIGLGGDDNREIRNMLARNISNQIPSREKYRDYMKKYNEYSFGATIIPAQTQTRGRYGKAL